MDTSSDSTTDVVQQIRPYVSCITCNGYPILPPLMTEARRTEMRHYRELAKKVEERLVEAQQTTIFDTPDSTRARVLQYTSSSASQSGSDTKSTDGTFIIKTNQSSGSRSGSLSDGEVLTDYESDSSTSNNDQVVILPAPITKSKMFTEDNSFKTRKRPATYFDSDESASEHEFTECSANVSKHSTNVVDSGRPVEGLTESPVLTPLKYPTNSSSFEIVLSKEIPSSAEKSLVGNQDISISGSHVNEGDSDKENQVSTRGRHVRKLSYTLSEPSAALIASFSAAAEAENESVEALSTIPSLAVTPLKPDGETARTYFENEATPTNQELDNRLDVLNRHLAHLQLGLGINKKAHLERYLGEVANIKHDATNNSNIEQTENEIYFRFQELKETHEKQMAALLKMHNAQQLQLKENFERQRNLLLCGKEFSPIVEFKNPNSENSTSPLELDKIPGRIEQFNSKVKNKEIYSKHEEPLSARSSVFTRDFDSRPSTAVTTSTSTDISNSVTITYSHYGPPESLGSVRLSKLQLKMQSMSPNVFKVPADSRSPLLKGLTFQDPLERPRISIKIPPKAMESLMKPKFNRVTATVKGYLTRRLLHTEKVQIIIQTIRDTVNLLLDLYEEAPNGANDSKVKPEDVELHRRSLQQLTGACASFHDVFFKLSIPERMAIIGTDRLRLRNKALKIEMVGNNQSPSKRNISTATLKSMNRRMSLTNEQYALSRSKLQLHGVSSRSSRQNQPGKISPKRRRMSHFVPPAAVPINTKNVPIRGGTNGNKWRVSEQIRASQLNATYTRGSGPSIDLDRIETNFSGLENPNSDIVFNTYRSINSRPTTAYSYGNTSTTSNNSRFSIGHSEISSKSISRKSVAARRPWK